MKLQNINFNTAADYISQRHFIAVSVAWAKLNRAVLKCNRMQAYKIRYLNVGFFQLKVKVCSV